MLRAESKLRELRGELVERLERVAHRKHDATVELYRTAELRRELELELEAVDAALRAIETRDDPLEGRDSS